jgi:hypothetical protein
VIVPENGAALERLGLRAGGGGDDQGRKAEDGQKASGHMAISFVLGHVRSRSGSVPELRRAPEKSLTVSPRSRARRNWGQNME